MDVVTSWGLMIFGLILGFALGVSIVLPLVYAFPRAALLAVRGELPWRAARRCLRAPALWLSAIAVILLPIAVAAPSLVHQFGQANGFHDALLAGALIPLAALFYQSGRRSLDADFRQLVSRDSSIEAVPAEYRFSWTPDGCHVDARVDCTQMDVQELLLHSYTVFVAQYCHSCERSQLQGIAAYVRENLHRFRENPPDHAREIHRLALNSSKPEELRGFSSSTPPGEGDYQLIRRLDQCFGQQVFRVRGPLPAQLELQHGPHNVLLPQLLLIFYCFVADNIEEEQVPLLNEAALEMLQGVVSVVSH